MKEIGGYFELELPTNNLSQLPPGVLVNSGRHALEYIIRALKEDMHSLWLPYYTCDVILQPIRRSGISFKFYSINERFELLENISLKKGEYIIVNNYFGIKDDYMSNLSRIYKNRLIIDNAQAFYCPVELGTNYIYSPRKFFGLPDGGIAFCTSSLEQSIPNGISYGRCSHLLKRLDINAECGYPDFRSNSSQLNDEPLTGMSMLTQRLMGTIDYEWIKIKRRTNFQILHRTLASSNRLRLPSCDSYACPMTYPYLTDNKKLRADLIENKVFVATYWPSVLKYCSKDSLEYSLAQNIIPLPIDQRYGEEEMNYIISIIKNNKWNSM